MDPAVVMVHPPKRPPLQVRFATIVFAFFGSQKQAIAKVLVRGVGVRLGSLVRPSATQHSKLRWPA